MSSRSKSKEKTLEDLIVDLYLNVKIRKQEEIENFDQESFDKERESLKKKNPKSLIEYIKSSIEILINLKVEEKINALKENREKSSQSNNKFQSSNSEDDDDVNEYEKLLRQLESEIRNHIRIEHQLKLHSDNLQCRVDELEKAKDELKQKVKKLSEQLKKHDSSHEESNHSNNNDKKKTTEINNLKSEVESLKTVIKSYEERNINISDLEKKIRLKQANFEKEIDQYKEKVKHLNKKILTYEEYIKKASNTTKDFSKSKNIIIGEILVDKHKLSQGQLNSLSQSTDKTKKDDTIFKTNNLSSSQLSRRILEKKSSMENLSHLQLNYKSKSVIRVEDAENKSHKTNNKIKDVSISSNNYKENTKVPVEKEIDEQISKTYRKATKELIRDSSKTNLAVKLTKHNRNNSYDISKNDKEKKTINSLKENTNNNFSNNNSNNMPYFNNINIFAANMNNFKTSELNLKQFVINKVNSKNKPNITKSHPRSISNVKN